MNYRTSCPSSGRAAGLTLVDGTVECVADRSRHEWSVLPSAHSASHRKGRSARRCPCTWEPLRKVRPHASSERCTGDSRQGRDQRFRQCVAGGQGMALLRNYWTDEVRVAYAGTSSQDVGVGHASRPATSYQDRYLPLSAAAATHTAGLHAPSRSRIRSGACRTPRTAHVRAIGAASTVPASNFGN